MFFFFFDDPLPQVEYPEQLYHYTKSDAFLSILKNKELWASHILFQNDKKEATYALDLLSESLNKNVSAFTMNNIDIQNLLSNIKPYIGQQIFTISFSEKCDDLNQWRSYGNSNPSYCLVFSPYKLAQHICKNDSDECYFSDVKFNKCIYNPETQREIINKLINNVLKELEELQITEKNIEEKLLQDFLTVSAFFKHPSFEEEQEWRLVFQSVKTHSVNIRTTKSGFIPYIKIPISEDYIKDIIISPCTESEYMLNSTLYVCSCFDINVEGNKVHRIKNSVIPYRK